jgi:carbonic anhydrase/acetyltransferase-like protein (isoleucine patch superfamily)
MKNPQLRLWGRVILIKNKLKKNKKAQYSINLILKCETDNKISVKKRTNINSNLTLHTRDSGHEIEITKKNYKAQFSAIEGSN